MKERIPIIICAYTYTRWDDMCQASSEVNSNSRFTTEIGRVEKMVDSFTVCNQLLNNALFGHRNLKCF